MSTPTRMRTPAISEATEKGVKLTVTTQLELLGWRVLDEGRQEDGRYCLLAKSCGHFLIALADTRNQAWSAACSKALRLTWEGLLRLPFRP